jgi:hypothetical protein
MLKKFTYILQRLMTVAKKFFKRNHFLGVMPFKVHVKFDIPLFEGQIDAYTLDKWLNLLAGY